MMLAIVWLSLLTVALLCMETSHGQQSTYGSQVIGRSVSCHSFNIDPPT